MIQELSINLPLDKFSKAKRILKHKQLIISQNLEMYQVAEVTFPEMPALINNDLTLSPEQKAIALEQYKSLKYDSNTAGSFVDASNGAEVLPDENGNFPVGVTVITELEFWQNLPATFFTAANLSTYHPDITFYPGNTLAELVYNGLLFSKAKMRERNRV